MNVVQCSETTVPSTAASLYILKPQISHKLPASNLWRFWEVFCFDFV